MNNMIQLRLRCLKAVTAVGLAVTCVGLTPKLHAVIPAPDGGYSGGNTAEGQTALLSLTTGGYNTAVGYLSLRSITSGSFNTAVGAGTLLVNTAANNTATGAGALLSNTLGQQNTANGTFALSSNTTGGSNTANGYNALSHNINGGDNTAIGRDALVGNTAGLNNTAIGDEAVFSNTTGNANTAIGFEALSDNIAGGGNTALGSLAGISITGTGNLCIGQGVSGEAGVDNRTYIRNVNTLTQNFSAGVNDYVTVRLSDGRLGHTAVVSSERYKEDIKPLAAASRTLYALKPVSFRLKKEFDPTQALGFGLIAEEVEKVDPGLVYHNNKGLVESVRYEMVNAMLLNEFLKEHSKVEKLEATVAEQQKNFQSKLVEQEERIEALASGLHKVSAQTEMSRSAAQVVVTDQ